MRQPRLSYENCATKKVLFNAARSKAIINFANKAIISLFDRKYAVVVSDCGIEPINGAKFDFVFAPFAVKLNNNPFLR